MPPRPLTRCGFRLNDLLCDGARPRRTTWIGVLSPPASRRGRTAANEAPKAPAEERCDAPLQSLLCDDASHRFSSRNFEAWGVGKPRDGLSENSDPTPVSDRQYLTRCRITPELSRAERGGWEPVLPAYPEVSTKPRNGVGLNDLLGGKEPGEGEALAHLPKGRSPDA